MNERNFEEINGYREKNRDKYEQQEEFSSFSEEEQYNIGVGQSEGRGFNIYRNQDQEYTNANYYYEKFEDIQGNQKNREVCRNDLLHNDEDSFHSEGLGNLAGENFNKSAHSNIPNHTRLTQKVFNKKIYKKNLENRIHIDERNAEERAAEHPFAFK